MTVSDVDPRYVELGTEALDATPGRFKRGTAVGIVLAAVLPVALADERRRAGDVVEALDPHGMVQPVRSDPMFFLGWFSAQKQVLAALLSDVPSEAQP